MEKFNTTKQRSVPSISRVDQINYATANHASLTNTTKQRSVPSISKVDQNNYATANHASLTHPSVCSRSSDYLESIFKKINSGDNVLSRIPSRLDPNIEFSDDEDDEPPAVHRKSPDKVKKKLGEHDGKGNNRSIFPDILKTPEAPHSSQALFNNIIYTQDKKDRKTDRRIENVFSNFSSASKINTSRVNWGEKRNVVSVSSYPSNAFTKTNLNTVFQPIFNQKSSENTCKKDINDSSDIDKNIYSLPSDIIQVNYKIYNVLSLLGSGGSCKVYSVYDVHNKSRVAIKRVDLKGTDSLIREGYMKEIEYLQKLQHSDRVIKMYDFENRENELLLVLEHGDIDFAKYISNEAKLKRLTPLMIKFFWVQMLEAVADIHKYGIVHSDLKPANFLLVAGNLKLIDFGIATSVPDDKTSTFRDTQVGTLNYMSPEAITQMSSDSQHPLFKVGVKSDVWSLGCILYNLVYGVTPFHNIKVLMQKICAITNPNYEILFKSLPDPLLLDVLKSCLKRSPKERASVEELLKHPYLAEDNASSASSVSVKPNTDLRNVLAQMQNLTPRRMSYITKVVQELAEKTDI